jgi:hypothetical protein
MSEWVIKQAAYKPKIRDLNNNDKTFQEIYQDVLAVGWNTDKGTTHAYVDSYAELFKPYRNQPINLLEIGIDFGYSLALWRAYFDKAIIHGIDNRNVLQFTEEVNPIIHDGNDPGIIDKYFSNLEFDIIIDDASHEVSHQVLRFPIYFPKLKKGGLYVIEDIQDLDKEGDLLKALDPTAEVIDNRKLKGRYDDVMFVYRK